MTYLSIAAAAWWLVAMTAVGVWIHAHRTAKAMRSFNDHANDALILIAARPNRSKCWPRDVDGTPLCGECGRLWGPGCICPADEARS